jgi:YVTN family beta-propeller protein
MAVDARGAHVFVLNRGSASVSVLDAHSGRVLRTRALDRRSSAAGAMARAMDARTGRVFVANGDADSVSVLDLRRGVVLRTLAVGVHPLGVAVDEKVGRAFVVNYGGSVREPTEWWAPWVSRLRRWLPWLPHLMPVVRAEPAGVSVIDVSCV